MKDYRSSPATTRNAAEIATWRQVFPESWEFHAAPAGLDLPTGSRIDADTFSATRAVKAQLLVWPAAAGRACGRSGLAGRARQRAWRTGGALRGEERRTTPVAITGRDRRCTDEKRNGRLCKVRRVHQTRTETVARGNDRGLSAADKPRLDTTRCPS